MRLNLFLVPFLAVGLAGCDQQQTKLLECERQLQAKDKMIADLAHTNNDLQQRLAKLQAGGDSDKLAETITESVAKRLEQQETANFGDIKTHLDEISRLQKAAPVAAAEANPPRGAAPNAPQPRSSETTDPSRKKYKFDF